MNPPVLRPSDVCKALLAALEGSEGRRRRRKRDQTPDTIGLGVKRGILERAIQDDPPAEAFHEWLLRICQTAESQASGSVSAMARSIYEEWRLAHSMEEFRTWLEQGAPTDDAEDQRNKDDVRTRP